MKTYGGSRSIAPFVLKLGIRWRSVVSITPRPVCHGRGLLHLLNRLVEWAHGVDFVGKIQITDIVHFPCNYITYKSKVVPLEAWSVPEGSRKLRIPDFVTTAQDGGKVVSLTAAFTPTKYSLYSFLLGAESTPGP